MPALSMFYGIIVRMQSEKGGKDRRIEQIPKNLLCQSDGGLLLKMIKTMYIEQAD